MRTVYCLSPSALKPLLYCPFCSLLFLNHLILLYFSFIFSPFLSFEDWSARAESAFRVYNFSQRIWNIEGIYIQLSKFRKKRRNELSSDRSSSVRILLNKSSIGKMPELSLRLSFLLVSKFCSLIVFFKTKRNDFSENFPYVRVCHVRYKSDPEKVTTLQSW